MPIEVVHFRAVVRGRTAGAEQSPPFAGERDAGAAPEPFPATGEEADRLGDAPGS